jgi:hypothetical protein
MEAAMEEDELLRIRGQFARDMRKRFPGARFKRVDVLTYGDDPEIEPGQLLARVVIEAPEDEEERRRAFDAFHDEHREALHELRRDLNKLPTPVTLKFTTSEEPCEGQPGPVMKLAHARGGPDGPGLTPVMARLGSEDLETLDMLITVGIAGSRAEAVRWALARIRERPAFEQLRAHTREIENLKSQF